MSKNKEYPLFVRINKDVSSVSFFSLHGNRINDSDKKYIVSNIEFKAIVPSIKKSFFYQHMMNFLNKLDSSGQKYQNNGNVRDEHYKENFSFPMQEFVSFRRYHR